MFLLFNSDVGSRLLLRGKTALRKLEFEMYKAIESQLTMQAIAHPDVLRKDDQISLVITEIPAKVHFIPPILAAAFPALGIIVIVNYHSFPGPARRYQELCIRQDGEHECDAVGGRRAFYPNRVAAG